MNRLLTVYRDQQDHPTDPMGQDMEPGFTRNVSEKCYLPPGNVGVYQLQHTDGSLVQLDKHSIVDLT